jgi:hypothetical protein
MNQEERGKMEPDIQDLQETKFNNDILSQMRERLAPGLGEITGDELGQKLINIFRESKSLRGKTIFDERVDDVYYFFCEDLRLEYEHKSSRLQGISLQELEDFFHAIIRPALERLKDLIEKRMENKGDDVKILPFSKE